MKTRTTVTFDPDVAIGIERMRRDRRAGLKEIVNDLLRRGLQDAGKARGKVKPFQTRTFDMGVPLIDLDNVAEALAQLQREDLK